jgi:hypothetical protein
MNLEEIKGKNTIEKIWLQGLMGRLPGLIDS